MKVLAYTQKNKESELITVHEALRRRKYQPDEWEKHTYYDIIKLREVIPVDRGASSSFSFKGGNGVPHGNGSKGIAHELAQQFLCDQPLFKFNLFKKEFDVIVKRSEDEAYIVAPLDQTRFGYIDVMLEIDSTCTNHKIFKGQIAIEITDCHKTTFRKQKLYKDLELTAIEIVIPKEWHVKNEQKITSQELKRLEARVRGFWNSRVYVSLINARNKLT